MPKKILITKGILKEKLPAKEGPGGGFLGLSDLEHGRLKMDDKDYCMRYGRPGDFKKLREIISAYRATIPAYAFWICKKCGYRMRTQNNPEEKEISCLKCNFHRFEGGGMMRRMTAAEIEKFGADESARDGKELERLSNAEFFNRNLSRQKEGLAPLTRAEFDETRKREWQRERAMMFPKRAQK